MTQPTKTMSGNVTAIVSDIARKYLGIETLFTRNRDDLDFHELSVWELKNALDAAYAAGLKAGKEGAA